MARCYYNATTVVVAVYILVLCITTYLQADHFTVGPKGSIVRAVGPRKDNSKELEEEEEEEEDLLSDPTAFFGSSSFFSPPSEEIGSKRNTRKSTSLSAGTAGTTSRTSTGASTSTGGGGRMLEENNGDDDMEDTERENDASFDAVLDAEYNERASDGDGDDGDDAAAAAAAAAAASQHLGRGQGGVFSMTSLSSTNAFYLTRGGSLMERFFNGYKWVYHAHVAPSPGITLTTLSSVRCVEDRETTLQYIGYVYASDAEGRLHRATQRRYFNRVRMKKEEKKHLPPIAAAYSNTFVLIFFLNDECILFFFFFFF